MKKENIDQINKSINLSGLIINYLYDYLKDKIDELIEDYEISEENIDEIQIIGYKLIKPNIMKVYVMFFDECSESGYGLEDYNVVIEDFNRFLDSKE